MAFTYTYKDFEDAAKASGYYFSDADMRLAMSNPDAGMSLLKYKTDYSNAQNAEARALANEGAENIRRMYGGYTGGVDGSSFLVTQSPTGQNIYTYKDFEDAAKASGYYFSDADMRLAMSNPDAGMSLLKYKTDYSNAQNAEARALAHEGAENIRSMYGEYTGGYDGGSFSLAENAPSRFNSGPAPTYNNRYDTQTQELINQILNRDPFSYNPESDQLYAQYQKAYAREGQRATQDAIGAAAAASGGIPSSYASTAAAQAGNYYAAQMSDKIPELYQIAYNKYLQDYQMQANDLTMLQNAEQIDYEKYLNEVNQFNTNRNFNYAAYLDSIKLESQKKQEAMNFAQQAYELGDTSYYENMGIDMSNDPTAYNRKYQEALLAMELGDYSKVEELFGIDTSNYSVDQQNKLAYALEVYTNTGDSSYLEALGIDMSNDPFAYERAMDIYRETGNTSYLEALGIQVPSDPLPSATLPSDPLSEGETFEDSAPENLHTEEGKAWLEKHYGSEIKKAEFEEIKAIYPNVTAEYLESIGIKVTGVYRGTTIPDVSNTDTDPNDGDPNNGDPNNGDTTTDVWSPPEGSPVWTPESDTPGFDQSSVTLIEKKLGINDLTAEKLNDLIDAGIVEHYIANNQDRFRLVNNWETLWTLYNEQQKNTNQTGGIGGGRTPDVANVQK